MRPLSLVVLALAAPLSAQAPKALTAEDYARAESTLGAKLNALVFRATVRPTWIDGNRFWYRNTTPTGTEYLLVDPIKKTRVVSQTAPGDTTQPGRTPGLSPDGKQAAFTRANNLWVRNVATKQERQLTTDGIPDYGYATDNAGWTKSDRPVVLWSPDSRRIATFQHDARGTSMMYLVNTAVGQPKLEAWKYPLPGDSVIFRISRVVIDVETGAMTRLRMPPDAHRSTLCDHVVCRGTDWADVEWYPDGSELAFVSTTRDHKQANLRVANPATGEVRDVLEEKVATQYESGFGRINWHVLPATNEFIWFSERDDWGNLYLYDLTTGRLKHQITKGPGPVLELIRIDEKARLLYYIATGREPGRDPYYRHLYRIDFDGKRQELLTPENGNHDVTLSPDGRFFIDTWSTPTTAPTTVLRDDRGRQVLALETADISRLTAAGWIPPIPFTVQARDGTTDLYGLMYRPRSYDSTQSYPVVNYQYPGPQSGSVGTRSFQASRGDKQAIAELGFIVVEVDAMGTPMRSKSFHDAYYGNMGDNGLPDQIEMIKQLGRRYPSMNLDKVGIWGHSGGGFAAADAILRYPDFYKVAVSQAGNHDNRTYEDDWGERYHGLLTKNADGTTNYDSQANQLLAKNLKGKLLIAHGTMDDNVPPNNTMALADALIKANKDFDLILMPNRRHGFGNEPYMMRRRWDFFVKHLLGAEPPQGYTIGAARNLVP